MSKAKNRVVDGGMVHATRRPKNTNYHVIRCNGHITYRATDERMAVTCLLCWQREFENYIHPRFIR